MEIGDKAGLSFDRFRRKCRYCVLFTQTLRQWEVTETIRKRLPEDRGTVFYPCVELWMGSLGRTVVEPLFPGYVFIRSDMGRNELHEFIRERSKEVLSFIRELHFSEEKAGGEAGFHEDDTLTDLSEEEAEFLDFMLGFRYGKEEQGTENQYLEIKAGDIEKNGKKIWDRKIPALGVMAMSYGYREKNGRCVVMEGPLQGLENHIVDVNPKDRRAYLNFKIGGRCARVGLELRSKRYWYPKDKKTSAVLGDGTEINLKEVAAAMMGRKDWDKSWARIRGLCLKEKKE